MDLWEYRRERLRKLIDADYHSNQSEFANAIDRQPDYISRILSLRKSRKNLGEDLVQHIEKVLHKPAGWFDKGFYDKEISTVPTHSWPFRFERARFDRLTAAQKDVISTIVEGRILEFETQRAAPNVKKRRAG